MSKCQAPTPKPIYGSLKNRRIFNIGFIWEKLFFQYFRMCIFRFFA